MKAVIRWIGPAFVAATSMGAAQPPAAGMAFVLSSPAFSDNAPLALKNAGNDRSNPTCVGENVSPPLRWANPPAGTHSYALILFDPEGRNGLGTYSGPCTPAGDWRHYTFTLTATDLDSKALQPGLTREELLRALNGHTKGAAGLIGRFRHPG